MTLIVVASICLVVSLAVNSLLQFCLLHLLQWVYGQPRFDTGYLPLVPFLSFKTMSIAWHGRRLKPSHRVLLCCRSGRGVFGIVVRLRRRVTAEVCRRLRMLFSCRLRLFAES